MVNIVGTPGADDRTGTNFSDTFTMGTGQDIMRPRQVQITPNQGLDLCDGGGGIDFLEVSAASEIEAVTVSVGGPGTFNISSVSGRYNIAAVNTELLNFTGGSGNDTVNSGNGGNFLQGNFGIDLWIADYSAVTQRISFRLGLDTSINVTELGHIESFEQMNLTTGSGRDFIAGAFRSDQIVTNAGNDTIDPGSVEVGGLDKVFAGAGIDMLVIDATRETGAVNVAAGFGVSSESGRINVEANSLEQLRFTGGSGDDTVNSGAGADRLSGGLGIDWWIADYSATGAKIDFTLGSTGDLRQVGLNSFGGFERISLTTGSGSDNITGGAQSDDIGTGTGNDTVDTGTVQASGNDRFFAGGGSDLLVVSAANETKALTVTRQGANFFVGSESGNFRIEAYDTERLQFTGGSGSDTVSSGDSGERLEGGLGIDQWIADYSTVNFDMNFRLGVEGSIAFTLLKSIFGFERMNLKTGRGDDRISGGNLSDDLDTGNGNDTVDARACGAGGLDRVFAGGGLDTLIVNAQGERDNVRLDFNGPGLYFLTSDSGRFRLEGYSTEKIQFSSGSGDDTIGTGNGGEIIRGGRGTDLWIADYSATNRDIAYDVTSSSSILPVGLKQISGIDRILFTAGRGDDTITGGNFSDDIHTGRGNDVIDTGRIAVGGLDRAFGDEGFDTLVVDASAERQAITVIGGSTFFVTSVSGRLTIEGHSIERVNVTGGLDGDTMSGGTAGDILSGGRGNDRLTGGAGADTMAGGAGADTFIYLAATDSRPNAPDRIADFGGADRIDLSAIDANTVLGGDQAFRFIGAAQFHSRAGELRYAGGRVFGDTGGDAIADIIIAVPSDTLLNRGDFVL